MMYIVRWYEDDSYIATFKRYSRKAAAQGKIAANFKQFLGNQKCTKVLLLFCAYIQSWYKLKNILQKGLTLYQLYDII